MKKQINNEGFTKFLSKLLGHISMYGGVRGGTSIGQKTSFLTYSIML